MISTVPHDAAASSQRRVNDAVTLMYMCDASTGAAPVVSREINITKRALSVKLLWIVKSSMQITAGVVVLIIAYSNLNRRCKLSSIDNSGTTTVLCMFPVK